MAVPKGPPAIPPALGPRGRPKAVAAPTDDENPYLQTLRGVEGGLRVDDQESWGLLRLATQVPRMETSTSSPSRPRSAAQHSANIAVPSSPLATSFAGLSGGVPSSPKRQPNNEALASIYNRAGGARGGAPQVPLSTINPEAKVLPPSTRISELEDGVAELLLALLRQERQNVADLKARAAKEGDESLARSRRCPAEAELSFRRLTSSTSPFVVEKPPGVIEAELSSLATGILSLGPQSAQRTTELPISQIPAQVEGLVATCQRHLSTVYRGDRNSARCLNAVKDLGDLLIEAERDTQAMAMALTTGGAGDSAGKMAARLGSVSKTLHPSMPELDSLAHQLEMENELIREALKRPPPDALRQASFKTSAAVAAAGLTRK